MVVAYTTSRRYYRPLRRSKCDTPYPKQWEYAFTRATEYNPNDPEQQSAPEEFELSPSELDEDQSQRHVLILSNSTGTRERAGSADSP